MNDSGVAGRITKNDIVSVGVTGLFMGWGDCTYGMEESNSKAKENE